MGPERYGEFAVLLSLLAVLWMASALGGRPAFGRFIPELEMQGKSDELRILFTRFFLLRGLLAVMVTPLFFIALQRLVPGIGTEVLWLSAAVFMVGAVSRVAFQLLYGLNRLGLSLAQDSSGRLLFVMLLLLVGGGFMLGNIMSLMLVIELSFLVLGLYLVRRYFSFGRRRAGWSDLYTFLKFGILFYVSGLALLLIWRGGEILVSELSGQNAEVAYYSIANAITMAFYGLFTQLSLIIVPSLSSLHVAGEHDKKTAWMANILRYVTLATWLAVIFLELIGEPVLVLLVGEEFLPVIGNLFILFLALVPMNVIRVGMSSALVHKRLKANFLVTASALVVFLLTALLLTPEYGAKGTSTSVVLGAITGAVVAHRVFALREILERARFWPLFALGLGAMALPWSGLLPEPLGGVLAMFLILAGVFWLRLIRLEELRWIMSGRSKTR